MGSFSATFSFSLVLLHTISASGVGDVATSAVKLQGNETNIFDNHTSTNTTHHSHKQKTVAAKVETLVEKEFAGDIRYAEKTIGQAYNKSAKSDQASMETVVRVSSKRQNNHHSSKTEQGNTTATNQTTVAKRDIEPDVDRMIDSHDNEFVLSKPKELASLTLDPVFIQDLTILYTSASFMGLIFESLGQPVINGYFVAGSVVGSGGFMLIKELVQVQSLAQLGVQLLLFHLGLEFSLSKMHSVGGVAFIGGLVEMFAFIVIGVGLAIAIGGSTIIGLFTGALVSLSSTSVVVNCLESSKTSSSQYGRITTGTLILQDCTVGILFAVMPLLGTWSPESDNSEESHFFPLMLSLVLKLAVLVSVGALVARKILPTVVQKADALLSQDLLQILLFSYCCLCALLTGWIGLSHELGAFLAGCLLSASPHAPKAIKSTEGARNIFMTLFMASIGLMMSPAFLWGHLSILTLSVLAVVVCKASVIGCIVRLFGFDSATSILVGLSLAQISEFAFVLLSIAVGAGILKTEIYLLLVGVTGLSLMCTPIVISIARSWLYRASAGMKNGSEDKTVAVYIEDQVRRDRDSK